MHMTKSISSIERMYRVTKHHVEGQANRRWRQRLEDQFLSTAGLQTLLFHSRADETSGTEMNLN
jgi:hypothetical protein